MERRRRPLKLSPQLVPKPLWRISAANELTRVAWQRIRQDSIRQAGDRCEICGKSPEAKGDYLVCHEIWDYDKRLGRATLLRLEMHCRACDLVTHMGRAKAHGNFELALEQLSRVNKLTDAEAKLVFRRAMADWKERNKISWDVVVDKSPLDRYPQLVVLDGKKSP